MEVMMLLDTDMVVEMKKFFHAHDDELSITEFVNCLRGTLDVYIHDDVEFTLQAVELFKQIDVDGNGGVDWDEFSGFMFQIGAIQDHKPKEASLGKRFFPTRVQDTNYHSSFVDVMYLIPAVNKFALLQHQSDVVQLYSLPTLYDEAPRQVGILRHHTAFKGHVVLACAFIEQRNTLVTSSVASKAGPCYLSMWEVHESLPLLNKRIQTPFAISILYWSVRLQSLFTAGSGSDPVLIWNIGTWRAKHVPMHAAGIVALFEMERGAHTVLCTASLDGTIKLWREDKHDKRYVVQQIDAHDGGVKCMTHSGAHHVLITCGFVNQVDAGSYDILLWRVQDTHGRVFKRLVGHTAQIERIVTLDTHSFVISADSSGAIKVWDIVSCSVVQTFNPSEQLGTLRSFALVPAGPERPELLIAGGDVMEFFALQNMRCDDPLLIAEFNTAFQMFMTVTAKEVTLWDAKTGMYDRSYDTELLFGDTGREITTFCLDDRERKVIVGNERGEISVHNYINGALMKQLDPATSQVSQVLYADVSKVVVSLSVDSAVQLLDEADPEGYYCPQAGQPLSVQLRTIKLVTDQEYQGGTSAVVGPQLGELGFADNFWDSDGDEEGSLFESSSYGDSPPRSARSVRSVRSVRSSRGRVKEEDSLASSVSSRRRPQTTRAAVYTGSDVPQHLLPFKTIGAVDVGPQLRPEVTCIAADYHLNVIVTASQTTAYDTYIHVWDFEMLRLLGTCVQPGDAPRRRGRAIPKERSVAELTALTLMSPFPAVVGGNAIGDVYIWPIRPSPLGYRCVMALTMPPLEGDGSVAVQITSVRCATGPEQDGGAMVIAGDNFGRVTSWKLDAAVLSRMTLRPAEHQRQADYRPFRHAHKQMPFSDMTVMKGVAIRGQRKIKVLDVASTGQWAAHTDAVASVRVIADPPSVLTAGVDGLAKVWSLEGRLLGRMDINMPRGHKALPWRFNMNVEVRERTLREEAEKVLDEANEEKENDSASSSSSSSSSDADDASGDGSGDEGGSDRESRGGGGGGDSDSDSEDDGMPLEAVLKELGKFEDVVAAEARRKKDMARPWQVPPLLTAAEAGGAPGSPGPRPRPRPKTSHSTGSLLGGGAAAARRRRYTAAAAALGRRRPGTSEYGRAKRQLTPLSTQETPQQRVARDREALLSDRVPSGAFVPGRQIDSRLGPLLGHSITAGSLDYGYGEVNKSNYKPLQTGSRQRAGGLLKREMRLFSLG